MLIIVLAAIVVVLDCAIQFGFVVQEELLDPFDGDVALGDVCQREGPVVEHGTVQQIEVGGDDEDFPGCEDVPEVHKCD